MTLTEPLSGKEIQRLVKPLPGYTNVLDNVAELLREDGGTLNLREVAPAAVLEVQRQQASLANKEAVAYAVYLSIYQQRQQLDDQGMQILFKVNRRVESREEEDPDLYLRWKFLRDYLRAFHPGRTAVAAAGGATASAEVSDEGPAPAPKKPAQKKK